MLSARGTGLAVTKYSPENHSLIIKKIHKNTCEKVHVNVYFSKILQKLKVISPYLFEIEEHLLSRHSSFFRNKNLNFFETEY